jgi:hypothetical protein
MQHRDLIALVYTKFEKERGGVSEIGSHDLWWVTKHPP